MIRRSDKQHAQQEPGSSSDREPSLVGPLQQLAQPKHTFLRKKAASSSRKSSTISFHTLAVILIAASMMSQSWWWPQLFPSSSNFVSKVSTSTDTSTNNKKRSQERKPNPRKPPRFAKNGEVPEELLRDKHVATIPIFGDWSHDAWKGTYPRLHGNNIKIICHLHLNETTYETNDGNPTSSSKGIASSSSSPPKTHQPTILRSSVVEQKPNPNKTSETSNEDGSAGAQFLPYRVLIRPLLKGGENEYLAYVVAQELGITKIPTQTILPDLFTIDTPFAPIFSDYVNIQSLLYGVQMTFLDEWTNCLPKSTPTEQQNTGYNNETGTTASLDWIYIGNDTSYLKDPQSRYLQNNTATIRLQPIMADTSQAFKMCLRNMDQYDGNWKKKCLTNTPTIRTCQHEEMAQLLEMALFDVLIANGERLHLRGGSSNNIHFLWPPHEQPSLSNTTGTMELVWLDHGHYSFGTQGREMLKFFQDYCIFSGHLLKQIFSVARRGSLSEQIKQRLGPKLLHQLDYALQNSNRQPVMDRLQVVDQQVDLLRNVLRQCAQKSGGNIHVMDYTHS